MNLTKTIKVAPAALAVIAQMSWREEGARFLGTLPPSQLDRKLYESVNQALEALGGRWDRKAKAHIFADDPSSGIAVLLAEGKVSVERDGFFPTPPAVVHEMINMLGGFAVEPILEPSAGEGAICDVLRELGYSKIVTIEKNEQRRKLLRKKGYAVGGDDFLQFRNQVPTIVMNPPFELMQDVTHITHAFENCLLPGGKLVSVCSEGPFSRAGVKAEKFRDLVSRHGFSAALPPNSFKESGTGVNTRLVLLERGVS